MYKMGQIFNLSLKKKCSFRCNYFNKTHKYYMSLCEDFVYRILPKLVMKCGNYE